MDFKFTLVSTVFNEASRIQHTINDIENQTVSPAEIIITDAGSTDGTIERLHQWKDSSSIPITILVKQGCNVAEGRNLAIRNSLNPIIVSTDFGCRFHPDWLKSLIEPFSDSQVEVVGGSYTVLETDIITKAAKAAYLISDGYDVNVHAKWFIPSSRSIAYRKRVFEKIGGYCEWLTLAADDLVFGKELLANGIGVHVVDRPYVYWGRHTSALGYVKESYRYGLGDGEARVNLRSTLSSGFEIVLRYSFFLFLFSIIFSFFLKFHFRMYWWLGILFLPAFRSYFVYFKNWLKYRSEKFNFSVFLYGIGLLERTRVSYLKGYLKGYYFSSAYQKKCALELKRRLAK